MELNWFSVEDDMAQPQPGVLKAISFDFLSEEDAAKISVKQVGAVNEVADPALGLPNSTSKCNTCGAQDGKRVVGTPGNEKLGMNICEGHFGLINLQYTVLNPYLMSEIAQVLNKICPACKSVRRNRVKNAASTSEQNQLGNCKYCDIKFKSYPPMKFKVSRRDKFRKTALIAEMKL
ncbi:PREDICTED: DNA-directed RNA polymerase IV subunit 1-like [Ipomoea nil]|uniref:DNA-directed RNA polymerase IV subunit 1-like n=1 Tax=Ipomoea nil TaxID=35883 RepID=UPI0009017472|nr:PREDICTED: DNA-directed RNA polymerase IV subunit 1-like [Ipomoea nil]